MEEKKKEEERQISQIHYIKMGKVKELARMMFFLIMPQLRHFTAQAGWEAEEYFYNRNVCHTKSKR